MKNNISVNNISFNFLKNSSDFLNLIINEISSCILLLDQNLMLQAYNDPIKTIFSNKKDEHLLYQRCGEAIGCAYAVEEMNQCGKTSRCSTCEIRQAALLSYVNKENVYKGRLSREFYINHTEKVMKHLQFSSRYFTFLNEDFALLIIDDISHLVKEEK